MSDLLDDLNMLKVLMQIRNYLSDMHDYQTKLENRPTKKKKNNQQRDAIQIKLFSNVAKVLINSLQSQENTNILLQLLSKSNPHTINEQQFQKIALKPENVHKISKIELTLFNQKSQPKITKNPQKQSKVKNSMVQQINQMLEQLSSKPEKRQKKITKLIMKKKQLNKPVNMEYNQQQIESRLFENNKIIAENIIFQKNRQRSCESSAKQQQFGKNWVYGYNLPYNVNDTQIQPLITHINKYYGSFQDVVLFPYKNYINSKVEMQIQYEIPESFLNGETSNNQHIGKNLVEVNNSGRKKTSMNTLLDKVRTQYTEKFNKSTILFKFQKQQSKIKFLSPELRLYGLNFKQFKNIRFQFAEHKNLLILSMIPWGCSSEELLSTINRHLEQIGVRVSYQRSLLAKAYIFIQFDSFYECFHAQKLLNNIHFQNHQLKAQLNYGTLKVYHNTYTNELLSDQYENMLSKLKNLKCFYNEVHR